jgi:hypothetical protein
MALGILLVRSRALLERRGGLNGRRSSRRQIGSAIAVTACGGIAVKGLARKPG